MVTERMLRRLEDVVYFISTTLSDYNPRRLGTREIEVEPGVMMPVTEIGEALHLIRTGIRQVIPHTSRVAVVGDLHPARGLWPAVVQPEQARLPAPRRDDRLQQLPGPAARRHVQPIAVRALLPGDAPQLPVQVGRRRGVGASADKPADAQRGGRGRRPR